MTNWKDLHLGQEALGGLSAGIVGTIIGFPLDLVKTRMQTMTSPSSSSSSILSVASHVIRTEGILAMYKGIGPPLLSLSILNTITFTQYSFYRHEIYSAGPGWDLRNGFAGISCAPVAGMVSTIENLVKTQMQLDNITTKRYRDSLHCVKTLVQEHRGIRILYTGHTVNTIREATFLGNYFFVYEGIREYLIHKKGLFGNERTLENNHTKIAVPIAGGLAGALSWFISFPLDCVRAGVQGQSLTCPKSDKKSAIRVFQELMQQRGIRGLYSGASASIVRAFLVSGSRFSAYEFALWLLRGGRDM